jgi:hypothetical protein
MLLARIPESSSTDGSLRGLKPLLICEGCGKKLYIETDES